MKKAMINIKEDNKKNDTLSNNSANNAIAEKLSNMISPDETIKTIKNRVVVETDKKKHTIWQIQRPNETVMFTDTRDKK